jgi:hypothetical protein
MDNRRPAIRIVIANNHPIFRDGLRRLLEAEPGLKVIGEASYGSQLREKIIELRQIFPPAVSYGRTKQFLVDRK